MRFFPHVAMLKSTFITDRQDVRHGETYPTKQGEFRQVDKHRVAYAL